MTELSCSLLSLLPASGGWGPRASGLEITYKAGAPTGQRLVSVKVGGEEVRMDQHYTIAGCEREGEPTDVICRHRGTHDAKVSPLAVHQVIEQYLWRHPVVSPRRDGRSVAVDLAPVVFSQDVVLPHTRVPAQ